MIANSKLRRVPFCVTIYVELRYEKPRTKKDWKENAKGKEYVKMCVGLKTNCGFAINQSFTKNGSEDRLQ